jgi:hypothetical protein
LALIDDLSGHLAVGDVVEDVVAAAGEFAV